MRINKRINKMETIIKSIIREPYGWSRKNLVEAIREATGLGKSQASKWISELNEAKVLVKDDDGWTLRPPHRYAYPLQTIKSYLLTHNTNHPERKEVADYFRYLDDNPEGTMFHCVVDFPRKAAEYRWGHVVESELYQCGYRKEEDDYEGKYDEWMQERIFDALQDISMIGLRLEHKELGSDDRIINALVVVYPEDWYELPRRPTGDEFLSQVSRQVNIMNGPMFFSDWREQFIESQVPKEELNAARGLGYRVHNGKVVHYTTRTQALSF